jgi:hypothetical protein
MKTQTRISRALAPVSNLVVLNAETTGTILLRQNALAKDLIAASVDQVKLLTEAGSLRDAVNFQRAYLRDIGTRVRSTGRENLDTLRHAGRDARGVLRDALRSARGRRVRIDARFRIEPVEAANVRIDVPGRDPGLAPVVVITPRSGWWHSTSERGGGIALWLDLLRMLADQPPQRPVIFSASTGHELGHLGMQRFLDANEALVRGAHAWIHLGANFATSLHPQVRLQASDSELMDLAGRAMTGHRAAPAVRTAIGARPFGEARDIDAGGGRYISLIGSSGVFHHPGDRWPDMVDLARTTDLAFAFREILGALTRT